MRYLGLSARFFTVTSMLLVVLAPGVQAQTTFTVTNTNSSGNGSLRQAIIDANANAGADVIAFDIPGAGPHSIRPSTALPTITDAVVIDGYSQPGSAANTNPVGQGLNAVLMVELNGTNAGADTDGLNIEADGSTVRGLVVNRFTRDGINLGGTENMVQGNFIGTNAAGTSVLPNGDDGVSVKGSNNLIGGTSADARNLISGNSDRGIAIGAGVALNRVQGNFIGTDASGTVSLGNVNAGVSVFEASNNTIGGTTSGARNLISGNGNTGIVLLNSHNNLVQGNYIGTDVEGTSPLPNDDDGMKIRDNATGNIVGGTDPGARNLISGNADSGIKVDAGSAENRIEGNYIGTDATGLVALANASNGVEIESATSNIIGGTDAGARNVISGNTEAGILIHREASENRVQGNYIGTDVTGATGLGNADDGVFIKDAPDNLIGGAEAGARNIISSNQDRGVTILGNDARRNRVEGNHIGTDATGASSLGNLNDGVLIDNAPNNSIGGTAQGAGNLISGNKEDGIVIFGSRSTNNRVEGNHIGTDASGAMDLGNLFAGVFIEEAPGNLIGGTTPGARNVISGNDRSGVAISGADATQNQVQGNYIGTSADGTVPVPNSLSGVYAGGGARSSIVGGTAEGAANRIAYNSTNGIFIEDGQRHLLQRNQIFDNADLGIELFPFGPTANDPGDGDVGSNNLQNYPEFVSAASQGASTLTLVYAVPSTTVNSAYPLTVEFFLADADDQEGMTFLGTDTYDAAEAQQQATVVFTPAAPASSRSMVVATATDKNGNTSEFSMGIEVTMANQPPSTAQITSPEDGAEITVGGAPGSDPLDPETAFVVTWTEVTDPDGDALSYTWELAASEDFAMVLGNQETGAATQMETTLGVLAGLLDAAGVTLGTSTTLFHRVVVSDGTATTEGPASEVTLVRGTLTATESEAGVPATFALEAAYPNPFNPQTVIGFSLPHASQVRLSVYDVLGREVVVLRAGVLSAGRHEATLEASGLPSGVYLYRLEAGGFTQTRRMLLVK